jgi:hypothetical protein
LTDGAWISISLTHQRKEVLLPYQKPVFKLLAHNDTKGAKGHQAGPLIPKDLAGYFPPLVGATSTAAPTVDAKIDAELWIGGKHVGDVETRYQHQTWHHSRRPERRITGNLNQLLTHAKKDDLLLIERDVAASNKYRLTLHKLGTPPYNTIVAAHPTRRWGYV